MLFRSPPELKEKRPSRSNHTRFPENREPSPQKTERYHIKIIFAKNMSLFRPALPYYVFIPTEILSKLIVFFIVVQNIISFSRAAAGFLSIYIMCFAHVRCPFGRVFVYTIIMCFAHAGCPFGKVFVYTISCASHMSDAHSGEYCTYYIINCHKIEDSS